VVRNPLEGFRVEAHRQSGDPPIEVVQDAHTLHSGTRTPKESPKPCRSSFRSAVLTAFGVRLKPSLRGYGRQACGCGIEGALGTSAGVEAGMPMGSLGGGTLAGAGDGTPMGSGCGGASGGVDGWAGAGFGFAGVGSAGSPAACGS
jgi:hypothetical protein